MDKATLNAQLVTTGLKRILFHLKSVDCERSDLRKKSWLPMKRMSGLVLLLVRLVFRRYE